MLGTQRYKSKFIHNYDICETCMVDSIQELKNLKKNLKKVKKGSAKHEIDFDDFYLIKNSTDDDILHEYI